MFVVTLLAVLRTGEASTPKDLAAIVDILESNLARIEGVAVHGYTIKRNRDGQKTSFRWRSAGNGLLYAEENGGSEGGTSDFITCWNGRTGKSYHKDARQGRIQEHPDMLFGRIEHPNNLLELVAYVEPLYVTLRNGTAVLEDVLHSERGEVYVVKVMPYAQSPDWSCVVHLDSAYSNMPIQISLSHAGEPFSQYFVDEYGEIDSVFYPKVYSKKGFGSLMKEDIEIGARLIDYETHLTSIQVNPVFTEADFDIVFPPGTLIFDEIKDLSYKTTSLNVDEALDWADAGDHLLDLYVEEVQNRILEETQNQGEVTASQARGNRAEQRKLTNPVLVVGGILLGVVAVVLMRAFTSRKKGNQL